MRQVLKGLKASPVSMEHPARKVHKVKPEYRALPVRRDRKGNKASQEQATEHPDL